VDKGGDLGWGGTEVQAVELGGQMEYEGVGYLG
jgi:hypothetical protein